MYYVSLIIILVVLIFILYKMKHKDKPMLKREIQIEEDTLGPLSIRVEALEEINGIINVTGFIERGTLKLGDDISVTSARGVYNSSVMSITYEGISVSSACAGQGVVIIIEGVTLNDISVGDMIYR